MEIPAVRIRTACVPTVGSEGCVVLFSFLGIDYQGLLAMTRTYFD